MQDVERLDGLAAESARLRTAFLTHYAVCNPPALMDEQSEFRSRAGLTLSREDEMAVATKTFEDYQKAMALRAEREAREAHSGD